VKPELTGGGLGRQLLEEALTWRACFRAPPIVDVFKTTAIDHSAIRPLLHLVCQEVWSV